MPSIGESTASPPCWPCCESTDRLSFRGGGQTAQCAERCTDRLALGCGCMFLQPGRDPVRARRLRWCKSYPARLGDLHSLATRIGGIRQSNDHPVSHLMAIS